MIQVTINLLTRIIHSHQGTSEETPMEQDTK